VSIRTLEPKIPEPFKRPNALEPFRTPEPFEPLELFEPFEPLEPFELLEPFDLLRRTASARWTERCDVHAREIAEA
jgi:hypothetical protein